MALCSSMKTKIRSLGKSLLLLEGPHRCPYSSSRSTSSSNLNEVGAPETEDDLVASSGISRPLSEILKELNKRVPDSLVKLRSEHDFSIKYIPWLVPSLNCAIGVLLSFSLFCCCICAGMLWIGSWIYMLQVGYILISFSFSFSLKLWTKMIMNCYRMVRWGSKHYLFCWCQVCLCCLSCHSLWDWCRGIHFFYALSLTLHIISCPRKFTISLFLTYSFQGLTCGHTSHFTK